MIPLGQTWFVTMDHQIARAYLMGLLRHPYAYQGTLIWVPTLMGALTPKVRSYWDSPKSQLQPQRASQGHLLCLPIARRGKTP